MRLAGLRIAMVAYANYYTDARIKNYVDALLDAGAHVDVLALGRGSSATGPLFVCSLGAKYWGKSVAGYVLSQALFMVRAFWCLLTRSLKGRYAVIHVHNMPNILALVGLPFKVVGTKVILDVHDTMPEAYATKFGLTREGLAMKMLLAEELLSAACAESVLTTNSMHKEVLAAHGIRPEKIGLIYNVGNPKIFRPIQHTANGQELWLGYHGTIARRLGVFLIIDALGRVQEECPGVRFLCIGEGDDLDELKSRAAQQSVAHMVEFRPFTEVENLPAELSKVELGVIGNTKETETKRNYMLPVKMLEYAAMEIPTIAPRLKIIERYFPDDAAFFYEPDSLAGLAATIRDVYRKREQITTKKEGLRRFNRQYNWTVMADRYVSLIHELTH